MHAKSLVDKVLYAERYLQNFSATPSHPYHGVGVFDQDYGTDASHAPHLVNTKKWFDGSNTNSPFRTGGVDALRNYLKLNFTSTNYYLEGLFTIGKTVVNHQGDTAIIESVSSRPFLKIETKTLIFPFPFFRFRQIQV
ncbi:MAG: hypothetical protein A2293_05245 [Elusimicrobia bacterium RIFOXYB2_FULL_49_7]|nr:MAG: hypothetical protein A2293_05245 [Elusimicrobia bacterium RIFOXYB2_FULL_49_7]